MNRGKRRGSGSDDAADFQPAGTPGTERHIVLFKEGAMPAGVDAIQDAAGVKAAYTVSHEAAPFSLEALDDNGIATLPNLHVGVAVVSPDQAEALYALCEDDDRILAVAPERKVYALCGDLSWLAQRAAAPGYTSMAGGIPYPAAPVGSPWIPADVKGSAWDPQSDDWGIPGTPWTPMWSRGPIGSPLGSMGAMYDCIPGTPWCPMGVGGGAGAYHQGYRSCLEEVMAMLRASGMPGLMPPGPLLSEAQATWGLQATNVPNSTFSGKGVKVAVLDTGIDLGHPDFKGRNIVTQSFIPGVGMADVVGHGTHCVGTACGPKAPGSGPRYGIAYRADIYMGKVLGDDGSGTDSSILAGIDWAVQQGCQVISMSLGSPPRANDPRKNVYEHVARRALAQGCLIVAAAGNASQRPQYVAPVGLPAGCKSVLAVAAVDPLLNVAPFSCGGLDPNGGQIDVAGPGVNVLSTWPMPKRYNTISGTSMATPHAAGIAALWVEATGFTGMQLWALLTQNARRLPGSGTDVGAGLVQAP